MCFIHFLCTSYIFYVLPSLFIKQLGFSVLFQIREDELSNTAQHIAFFPATAHQTTGEQTEKDYTSCGSQGRTDTPQPSPSDEELGVLINEITAEETTNDYTEGSTIESDITYNCINETIWI